MTHDQELHKELLKSQAMLRMFVQEFEPKFNSEKLVKNIIDSCI